MFDLAKMADRYAEREDVSGIVVTHGTDTLEETAYMLGLAVKTNKPVCLTGAMRGASETGPDGPANILAAVMVAASDEAWAKAHYLFLTMRYMLLQKLPKRILRPVLHFIRRAGVL